MFTDHSGKYVPLRYLTLLEDFAITDEYSRGSVVLSYLYRELCKSTDYNKKEIVGVTPLIKLWHGKDFRPLHHRSEMWFDQRHHRMMHSEPLFNLLSIKNYLFLIMILAEFMYLNIVMSRWLNHRNYSRRSNTLQHYQLVFDKMKPKDVSVNTIFIDIVIW